MADYRLKGNPYIEWKNVAQTVMKEDAKMFCECNLYADDASESGHFISLSSAMIFLSGPCYTVSGCVGGSHSIRGLL